MSFTKKLGSTKLSVAVAIVSFVLLYLLGYYQPQLDYQILEQLSEYKTSDLDQVALWVTQFGAFDNLLTITIVLALVLALFNWRISGFTLLCMTLSAGAMQLIKLLTERTRPDVEWAAYQAGGYSFPSGHASVTLTLALILGLALNNLAPNLRKTSLGKATLMLPVVCAVLIGLTRPYLGVHFLTDVLAGWALAIGIVAVLKHSVLHRLDESD